MGSRGEMQIEGAVAADVAPIAALWHAGWHDGHAAIVSPELVASRVAGEFPPRVRKRLDRTYVARIDGVLAGFYMLEGDELYQFYVDAAFRGQGVAGALMTSAEGRLAGRLACLDCSVGNDRAARFYEKAGWQRRPERVVQVETAGGPMDATVWRFEKDLRTGA